MAAKKIKEGIYWVGAVDWDRTIFDELVTLPEGTSYNAYIVFGSGKTALIDTVEPLKGEELLRNLKELKVNRIDYIVSNHSEQDHSGMIPEILKLYPEAKVVTNKKCKQMLIDLLDLPENVFQVIEDGETLSLGDKTLQFFLAPWVHWPETMFTYAVEDKVLFTCDFLGSHIATSELFDTSDENRAKVYLETKRYYAEIMMPFRNFIKKHLALIDKLQPEILAPSHGVVIKETEFILNAYRRWVSDEVKPLVIIPFISMHESTRRMVDFLTSELSKRGIAVRPYNLTSVDIGNVAMDLVDAAGVVFASPTVLAGAHPAIISFAYLVNCLRPKTKLATVIGSYGWNGVVTVKHIQETLRNLKAEWIEPVMVKGLPKEEDYTRLEELADKIAEKVREYASLKLS
ncbi:FprA family A-type flavoprotein [Phorcysia thermohydrogeniphila]|uniref:Flavorubredoxin n=1 Tax=Phorcysia thermohydrogeniphila TaxID=936138 RepID=A0A4R1GHM7_9BACT|nr:FprA family A-type flavoprotein [Phorcysia thermohydrogeniphila]TCK06571.1 flavorubredoxin [Phorcysia thermohydrogeniphila]